MATNEPTNPHAECGAVVDPSYSTPRADVCKCGSAAETYPSPGGIEVLHCTRTGRVLWTSR